MCCSRQLNIFEKTWKQWRCSSFCPVFNKPVLHLYPLLPGNSHNLTLWLSDSNKASRLLPPTQLLCYQTAKKNGNGRAPMQTGCPRCSSCQTCRWSARECRRDTEETDCGVQICSCTRVRRYSLCSRIILQSSETLAAAGGFTVTQTLIL